MTLLAVYLAGAGLSLFVWLAFAATQTSDTAGESLIASSFLSLLWPIILVGVVVLWIEGDA